MARGNRRQVPVELSLEKSQVTTLVVGSVVALGIVFLLGVGFGKRLAQPEGSAETPAAVAAAPAAAAPAEKAPELTFHDALTSKRVRPPKDAPAIEKRVKEKAAEKRVAAKKPEPGAAPAPKAEQAERAEEKPEPTKVAEAPAPKVERKTEPEPQSEEGFTVQVASSQDRADTERLVEKLEAAGYRARIVEAEIPGRGIWYRVRIGTYPSREDAALKQAEIKVALNMSGLVVAN